MGQKRSMEKPNWALMVGVFSICLCFMAGIACGENLDTSGSLGNIKEFHSAFIHHQQKSSMGQLELPEETIYFPWANQAIGSKSLPVNFLSSSHKSNEQIQIKGPQAKEQIGDLKAINSVKQRDVVYEEVQNGDKEYQGLRNYMDIKLNGPGQRAQKGEEIVNDFSNDIEKLVDHALISSTNHISSKKSESIHDMANNLDIDVSGISVSAINTVQGGNAVATSNIIIKPVQIIIPPSEADEKLK